MDKGHTIRIEMSMPLKVQKGLFRSTGQHPRNCSLRNANYIFNYGPDWTDVSESSETSHNEDLVKTQ
jgi:hypothetical protein